MAQLFKKAACITDIHFGRRNNDKVHNEDCSSFIDFFIDNCKKNDVDTIIFTGDWHDNRHSIQLSTLDYSYNNLKKLNDYGSQVYFIPGNHDLFYKEKRDVTSVVFADEFKNIKIIDEIYHKDNVTFFPWLIKDDYKQIKKYAKKSEYIFGHFEIPTFLMNAKSEMPNTNQVQPSDFDEIGSYAFSGHFHKRQVKNKICYLGNVFPFDFNDNWDDDRGMMLLGWKENPTFLRWDKAPKFRTLMLSELLEDIDLYLDDRTTIKISQDIELDYEEMVLIKDIIYKHYNPRKVEIKSQNEQITEDTSNSISFQSIDQIVTDGLKSIDSNTIDKNKLIEIYEGLS